MWVSKYHQQKTPLRAYHTSIFHSKNHGKPTVESPGETSAEGIVRLHTVTFDEDSGLYTLVMEFCPSSLDLLGLKVVVLGKKNIKSSKNTRKNPPWMSWLDLLRFFFWDFCLVHLGLFRLYGILTTVESKILLNTPLHVASMARISWANC